MDFAIAGGGRWGTALATHLARKGHRVFIYEINERSVEKINSGLNPYFKGLEIPSSVKASTSLEELNSGDVIICALPVQNVREVFSGIKLESKVIINASKGLELDTFKRVSEIIKELQPGAHTLALSGPSFALEVAKGLPTALVLAHEGDRKTAEEIQRAITQENFRVYLSPDLCGVELGGALKNVIAIACGISDGLGYGHNARSALLTRGLAEMTRIGTALGGLRETFYGLSGLGDLVLTSTSDLSRNRTFGTLIGRGLSTGEALAEIGQTVEGERTVRALQKLTREKKIYAPITEAVYRVVVLGEEVGQVVRDLLSSPPGEENPPQ
jgi:glycerol-3-phosphate dehydrogenase (NAD(P)+)